MNSKKTYIKLIKRDLRMPERNEPLLLPNGEPHVLTMRSDYFCQMWANESGQRTFMIADNKDLKDLNKEGLLDDLQYKHLLNEMERIEMANMTPEQRMIKKMEDRIRKELESKYEKKATRTRKTNS